MEGIKMLLTLSDLIDETMSGTGLDFHVIHTYFGGN